MKTSKSPLEAQSPIASLEQKNIQEPGTVENSLGSKLRGIGAIVITFALYVLSQLFAGLFLIVLILGQGLSIPEGEKLLAEQTSYQFAFYALYHILALLMLWAVMRRSALTFRKLGIVALRTKDIIYAAAGFFVYMLTYISLLTITRKIVPSLNVDQRQELGYDTSASGPVLVLIFISLVILPPLIEELIMRGYLYGQLKKGFGILSAAIITSILFAVAHLQLGSGNDPLWVAAIDTFVLSLVLIYLREKTSSLWASIMLHALKNSIAFIFLFIFKIS